MKPKVFKGDTFRALLLQYSFARMSTDPAYRRDVRKALAEKKAEKRMNDAGGMDSLKVRVGA